MKSVKLFNLLVTFSILSSLLVPFTAKAQSSSDFIQAQGANLVYKGQVVKLVGANLNNIEALCAKVGNGAPFGTCNPSDIVTNEADYQRMAQEGGNHFRFGMAYAWYRNDKNKMFQVLDQHVQWAKEHGIWIVWNVFTLPDDCYEGYGYTCPFWNSSTQQNQLKQFWVDMANRYKNEPAVAGYDLLNEPTPPSDLAQWQPIAQSMINAIRQTGSNQLIFVNGVADPVFNSTFSGGNIVYEHHDYTPMNMSHSGSPASYPGLSNEWCGTVLWSGKTIIGQSDTYNGQTYPSTNCNNIYKRFAVEWSKNNNVPYYIGEWGPMKWSNFNGAYNYVKDRGVAYNDVFQINHAFYTWKHNRDNWGIFPIQRESSASGMTPWFPQMLEAAKFGWAGNVRPNFGGGGVITPTPGSTVNPTATATQAPTASPTPGPTPLPGDANGDGKVDGLDYVRWLNNYGKTSGVNVSNGDFNGDGKVDGLDYVRWLNNYGRTGGPTATTNPTQSPTATPSGTYPRELPRSAGDSRIAIMETQARNGNTVYVKAQVDPSVTVVNIAWYINGGWNKQENGSGTSLTLPTNPATIRAVVYYNTNQNFIEASTNYSY